MSSTIKVNNIQNLAGDDSGFDLSTNDQVDIKTANTTRVRVDSTGRVLIGADSGDAFNDDAMLRLQRTGDRVFQSFKVDADQSAGIFFGDVDDDIECGITYEATNQNLIFSTGNNSEAMRIISDGKVLIGQTTTSGVGGLSINPNLDDGACRLIFDRSATSATSLVIEFENGDSRVGDISHNSSSTTYATSSDYRLKENVVTDWDATTRLKQLKPSRFNFKVDKEKTVDGFLAHEVSSIVPEAVRGEKDAVDEDGNIDPQGIDQGKLVPLLTKALQEAIAKIETLEAKVTALEGK